MTIFRIIINIIIFIAVINGWWFLALPLGVIATWRFRYYLEIIIAGIYYDALFGSIPALGIWGYAGTITGVSVVLLVFLLKKLVR